MINVIIIGKVIVVCRWPINSCDKCRRNLNAQWWRENPRQETAQEMNKVANLQHLLSNTMGTAYRELFKLYDLIQNGDARYLIIIILAWVTISITGILSSQNIVRKGRKKKLKAVFLHCLLCYWFSMELDNEFAKNNLILITHIWLRLDVFICGYYIFLNWIAL